MKRLAILLDNVAYVRSTLKNNDYDPVQFAILGETAGAHGLVCTYTGSADGIKERDLRILKEIRKSFFNVRIPPQEQAFRLVLALRPDMVTFVDLKSSQHHTVYPLDTTVHLEYIQQMTTDLQANNISVSALIKPEINILKNINRLQLDYIEIDVNNFTHAENINEELIELDKIKSTAMGATKLGLGVNASGGIRYEHLSSLAQVSNLEDIVLGDYIIHRSMLIGVEQAIKETLQLIRLRESD
jgi:pyridoxine 5-phosphate synthase